MQPLINLGRLHIRDGEGTSAYQIYESLFQAAKTRTEASVEGRTISMGATVRSGDDQCEIVRWLWTILLADGLRALCRAGRWPEALHQAERHSGVGHRLLDGRQIAILANCTICNHTEALRLMQASATPSSWDKAVAACLKVICLIWAAQPADLATAAMVQTYLALDSIPEHAVFHVRLGLSVADLAHNIQDTQPIIRKVERSALDAADAYVARDVRTNDSSSPLTEAGAHVLDKTVQAAGLGTPLSPQLLADLMQSVQKSETALIRGLRHRRSDRW